MRAMEEVFTHFMSGLSQLMSSATLRHIHRSHED